MTIKCEACGKFVAGAEIMGCECCTRIFHFQCLNQTLEEFRSFPRDNRKIKKCSVCKMEERSVKTPTRVTNVGGTSTSTAIVAAVVGGAAAPVPSPVARPAAPPPTVSNVNSPAIRHAAPVDRSSTRASNTSSPLNSSNITDLENRLMSFITSSNQILKKEIRSIIKSEITAQIAAITTELNQKIILLEEKTIQIQVLEDKFEKSQERILELENSFNAHQQWLRINNLEISGVPQLPNESVTGIAIEIAKHAGVALKPEDIEFANRVQPARPLDGRPKNIVIKLKQRRSKDDILSGLRRTRGVSTADIGMRGDSVKIYVHDHLTPSNKKLLKDCKLLCSSKEYKYIWVKHCNIYARKADQAPLLHIRSTNDFRKIV